MKKSIVASLLIIMVASLYSGCFFDKQADANENQIKSSHDMNSRSSVIKYNQNLNVGFNAKGSLSVTNQVEYLKNELSKLKKENIETDKIWLRLQGGTLSQKTYPSDWNDNDIKQWAQLQKDFGCQYIFVVNFNDPPESQAAFYKRLTNSGIKFTFIELGNEQYLSKFKLSKTDELAKVTKRTSDMTPQKYISMCNEYINVFKSIGLPFYVQFAPEKEDSTNTVAWNTEIAKAINNNAFAWQNINGTIHLYERYGDGSLNEKQINAIRNLVTHPILIAITEFGVVDKKGKLSEQELIAQETHLTTRLLSQLQKGDVLLNQVLYTDYKEVGASNFHEAYNGITPKGKAMFDLFKKYW